MRSFQAQCGGAVSIDGIAYACIATRSPFRLNARPPSSRACLVARGLPLPRTFSPTALNPKPTLALKAFVGFSQNPMTESCPTRELWSPNDPTKKIPGKPPERPCILSSYTRPSGLRRPRPRPAGSAQIYRNNMYVCIYCVYIYICNLCIYNIACVSH